MALARGTDVVPYGYTRGYSLEDAASFLQYDRETVRYWLRVGQLNGQIDPHSGEWTITTPDLIAFIRASCEPMPTGVIGRAEAEVTVSGAELRPAMAAC